MNLGGVSRDEEVVIKIHFMKFSRELVKYCYNRTWKGKQ